MTESRAIASLEAQCVISRIGVNGTSVLSPSLPSLELDRYQQPPVIGAGWRGAGGGFACRKRRRQPGRRQARSRRASETRRRSIIRLLRSTRPFELVGRVEHELAQHSRAARSLTATRVCGATANSSLTASLLRASTSAGAFHCANHAALSNCTLRTPRSTARIEARAARPLGLASRLRPWRTIRCNHRVAGHRLRHACGSAIGAHQPVQKLLAREQAAGGVDPRLLTRPALTFGGADRF